MKVIIAGARDKRLSDAGLEYLDDFFSKYNKKDIVVLNGDCKTGIDRHIKWYCETEKIPIKLFPAKWNDLSQGSIKIGNDGRRYNASAGPIRNKKMLLEAMPNGILIVFNGGKGTNNIYDQGVELGINIIDLRMQLDLIEGLYEVDVI